MDNDIETDDTPETLSETSRFVFSKAQSLTKQLAQAIPGKTRRNLPDDAAYLTPHPDSAAHVSPEDIIPMRADFSDFQEEDAVSNYQNKMV